LGLSLTGVVRCWCWVWVADGVPSARQVRGNFATHLVLVEGIVGAVVDKNLSMSI